VVYLLLYKGLEQQNFPLQLIEDFYSGLMLLFGAVQQLTILDILESVPLF
jgi:hypothetical protein